MNDSDYDYDSIIRAYESDPLFFDGNRSRTDRALHIWHLASNFLESPYDHSDSIVRDERIADRLMRWKRDRA